MLQLDVRILFPTPVNGAESMPLPDTAARLSLLSIYPGYEDMLLFMHLSPAEQNALNGLGFNFAFLVFRSRHIDLYAGRLIITFQGMPANGIKE